MYTVIKNATFYKAQLVVFLMLLLLVLTVKQLSAQTYCTNTGNEQVTGEQNGYRYELWNQYGQGTACITIGDGALFSGEWDGIQNYLARRGLSYDETQKHNEIGVFYADYNCDYNPSSASGNSYLSIYGWTVDPLIEYYIVEDWRNWIPSMDPGATKRGTITVNGSTYDIYENTRVNQPSIKGTATFQQYFSIRRDERNSGTINISEHFQMWESLGMQMGNMFEVSFVVEGYQSSGNFEFTELDVTVNDEPLLNSGASIIPSQVKVYSGSNSGEVKIEIDEKLFNSSINIYDLTGKLVYNQKDITTNLLLVSNLKSGIYIVNVSNAKSNYSSKFSIR